MSKLKHKFAVLGGTFDHFHTGHEHFLHQAFKTSQYIYCGLVKKPLAAKSLTSLMQPYSLRFNQLQAFSIKNGYYSRIKVFPLNDQIGMKVTDSSLQTIIATKETINGTTLFNQGRLFLDLPALKVSLVDLLSDRENQIVSSTRIRTGQINRLGCVYSHKLQRNLFLPPNQRQHFKKPIGSLLTGSANTLSWSTVQALNIIQSQKPTLVVTVGDIVTHSFAINHLPFNLAVLDFKSRRQLLNSKMHHLLFSLNNHIHHALNLPGTISLSLVQSIQSAINQALQMGQKQIIVIKGEEDLAVLPLVLLLPLNSLVFYGQPASGIVSVHVTESLKEKVKALLNRFTPYRAKVNPQT